MNGQGDPDHKELFGHTPVDPKASEFKIEEGFLPFDRDQAEGHAHRLGTDRGVRRADRPHGAVADQQQIGQQVRGTGDPDNDHRGDGIPHAAHNRRADVVAGDKDRSARANDYVFLRLVERLRRGMQKAQKRGGEKKHRGGDDERHQNEGGENRPDGPANRLVIFSAEEIPDDHCPGGRKPDDHEGQKRHGLASAGDRRNIGAVLSEPADHQQVDGAVERLKDIRDKERDGKQKEGLEYRTDRQISLAPGRGSGGTVFVDCRIAAHRHKTLCAG